MGTEMCCSLLRSLNCQVSRSRRCIGSARTLQLAMSLSPSICEEFGLSELSDKILEQLTYNKAALSEVAHSRQIMSYPKLMQAILQCAASGYAGAAPEQEPQPQKSKRGRKA